MLRALLRCLPDGELLAIPAASRDPSDFQSRMQDVVRQDRASTVPMLLIAVTVHATIRRDRGGVAAMPSLRPASLLAERLILAAPGTPRSEAREAPDFDSLLCFARQRCPEKADWLVCSWNGEALTCGMGEARRVLQVNLPVVPGRYGLN